MSRRTGWLDCSAGAAGDMLVAALAGAGVPTGVLEQAVAGLRLPVRLVLEEYASGGLAALRAVVTADEVDPPARSHRDVVEVLAAAELEPEVRELAGRVFQVLAAAEAAVHGTTVDDVHFHEVGALDALADVVACAAGFVHLGLDRVVVSPVALGSGQATSEHGSIPVPVPAVLEIARRAGLVVTSGTADFEQCTPTGAAVLAAVATDHGPLPAMTVESVGLGAGTRRLPDGPNVVRLVVGHEDVAEELADRADRAILLETNVDDLDPRLWPAVLERLLTAGASDAWLTPILMKKGRPAYTLSVLCREDVAAAAQDVVFRETSAIGLRRRPVDKVALRRTETEVELAGGPVRVKLAWLGAELVNVQPEYEDVRTVAESSGQPVKAVLAEAAALARAADRARP